ncbi:MAG: ABC transporter substrate-binding protein [Acidimicrobiia bacterium]|nr:MAG: ABC transporter substrate-binding protein [Acidimicrobiia bacterium]
MTKRFLLVVFAFALVVAACTSSDDTTTTTAGAASTTTTTTEAPAAATTTTAAEAVAVCPSEAGGGTVVIGTTDAIASLDTADAYAVRDWEVLKNFGEPLLKWVPGAADELQLGIAESMPVASEDGLTWTVTLRDGLLFGDGTPVTAQIVASQLTRLLTISETGPNQVGLTLGNPYVDSIEAVDDRTVQFNLPAPIAFFQQLLASASYIPANPAIFPEGELNIFPEPPLTGTGPWIVTEIVPEESMTLEPNPNYYGDQPNLDRVIVRQFADPQSMALAVQSGEIDVAWRILGAELATELGEVDGLNSVVVPSGPIRYLIINHVLEPTNDPNVRKAIASVIDRDELSDVIFGGAVDPLFSQVPPGFLGANEAFEDLYGSPDLDAARAFLEASGYSEDNKLQLPVWYPPEHYGATTADGVLLIVQQLEATGMIDVSVQAQEWGTYVGAATSGEDYAVSVLGWFFDFPDPENYLQPFIENGGIGTMVTAKEDGSITPGVSPELLTLLTASRLETDLDARAAILDELQKVYADEVVTVPLWIEPEFIVYRDGICGDASLPNPQTLNIGGTMEFVYSVLNTDGS